MDLAKFLSLLDKEALFFVRVDKLAVQDPFEGFYTNVNVLADKIQFSDTTEEWRQQTGIQDEKTLQLVIESNRRIRDVVKADREVTFASSWHTQEHESAAMWNLYVRSSEGIAVESSYDRLVAALQDYGDFEVHIGMMKYIDYQREFIPLGNMLSPFMYKRKSFEHEKELRALIWTPQHGKNVIGNPALNKFRDHVGLCVPVNLEVLISRVFVAPTAPHWMLELLESVVKKYGLKAPVVQSDLASTPVY
jgi:hypothetical protein